MGGSLLRGPGTGEAPGAAPGLPKGITTFGLELELALVLVSKKGLVPCLVLTGERAPEPAPAGLLGTILLLVSCRTMLRLERPLASTEPLLCVGCP